MLATRAGCVKAVEQVQVGVVKGDFCGQKSRPNKTGIAGQGSVNLAWYSQALTLYVCADGREVTQALTQVTPGSSAVLSNLIASCEVSEQPAQTPMLAWSLWEHAGATGHTVSVSAQDALWNTQSGQPLPRYGCCPEMYLHCAY